MVFVETKLKDVFIIELERIEDDRGFFARTFCQRDFESRGLNRRVAQCSISFNKKKGTLRGLHYQAPPYAEAKLVRCTKGAIYDVAVDLRPDSPSYKQWAAVDLSEDRQTAIYIPEGCAHGFQTLEDDTEVYYQISEFYHPESGRGIRWDDPAFGFQWPLPESPTMSERDKSYADYSVRQPQ